MTTEEKTACIKAAQCAALAIGHELAPDKPDVAKAAEGLAYIVARVMGGKTNVGALYKKAIAYLGDA